jgi:hypothetical protein
MQLVPIATTGIVGGKLNLERLTLTPLSQTKMNSSLMWSAIGSMPQQACSTI